MSADPIRETTIRDALEAAAAKVRGHVELPQPEPLRFADRVEARTRMAEDVAAAAVATFLRALLEGTTIAIADPAERRIRLAREIADAL